MPSVDDWIETQTFESTTDIKIPESLVDEVIGQDEAVAVARKAADQKRHVMLIGDPGTGKSMLARSMSELLPAEELQDIIVYHNPEDANEPKIRVIPAGKGKEIVQAHKAEAMKRKEQRTSMMTTIIVVIVLMSALLAFLIKPPNPMVLLFGILVAAIIFMVTRYTGNRQDMLVVPKLLVGHDPDDMPPFVDATGSHAGALLGDVRHDPFQSGGLETPAHERVESGAIHKSHKGILFVDEINILRLESQQSLLTALQERKFSIIGQSERSAGAMVKTEPVPCDFILVAAGNLDALSGMHPALRSRIRGYGYEVYVKSTMPDTMDNREKMIRFVAQEVVKDGKIPHFDRSGVLEIIREAQRRAGRRGQLTLRLRELGGLIRVAGDIARERGMANTTAEHVLSAKKMARSLEQQVADRYIERRRDYKTFVTEGTQVGVVNGLAVLNADPSMAEFSGIVLPIVAEVTPAQSRNDGKIIATGRLGEIAKEAVQNVSAVIKKYTGEDVSNYDIHVQFVGTHEGVEGDSASISVATAVISALEEVEVDQTVAMTGSLSIRGQVLPVGGITAKVEAAAEMGFRKALIPKANINDVLIESKYVDKIEIVPVETIKDVLDHALVGPKKSSLIRKLATMVSPRTKPGVPRDRAVPQ
ncbi:MAG: ATP-dependent protease LonB [Thermoplasmata archaeon]